MTKIEIITYERELPQELTAHYGVELVKVAETDYFTIFALTIDRPTDKSDLTFLDKFIRSDDIILYEWSRPIKIRLTQHPTKK